MSTTVRFRHPVHGARRQIQFPAAPLAAAFRAELAELRAGYRAGRLTAADVTARLGRARRSDRLTLSDAAATWAARVAPRTSKETGWLLTGGALRELAPLALDDLDAPRLDRWIHNLEASYAPTSIGKAWAVLSAIVRGAISRQVLEALPWGDWRLPRRIVLTPRPRECCTRPEQARALLDAAAALDAESDWRHVPTLEARIACGLFLGARSGELAGLRWSDLDPARGCVTIARQFDDAPTKARRPHAIAAPPECFTILDTHRHRLELARRFRPTGPIFPVRTNEGRIVHSRTAVLSTGELRRAVVRAGLPHPERWTVHSLRASFICLELASSGSLAHTMVRSRHRSLRATQAYARGLLDREPPPPSWRLPPAPPPAPELEP